MDSLSRPLHRRKLSNANSFSGKNAYDGVFSGHRPKFDGVPVVKLEDYCEIFSSAQGDSSIPVLDVSSLEESSDGFNLELGSMKPDYSKIFGGFRDEDIAVSYQDLLARDKARASFSTSPCSQDSGDSSHQSSDAMKQFNLSYNKISQRNKDGLDGTTHVTQLHAVPGFTCFINEGTSQPKKGKKKKSSVSQQAQPSVSLRKQEIMEKETLQSGVEFRNRYHDDVSLRDGKMSETLPSGLKSLPSEVSSTNNETASLPNKETEKQKASIKSDIHPSVNSSKRDFLEDDSSRRDVESRSKYQNESLSDDKISESPLSDLKSHPSKVSSSAAASVTSDEEAFQPKKETQKQKSSISSNVHASVNSSKQDFLEKQTSQNDVESRSRDHKDGSLSEDRISETLLSNHKSHPSEVSSPPAAPVTNIEAASQPNKESEKQKSSVTNNIHPSMTSSKQDFLEKETSQSGVESSSEYRQDESLSDDRISKTFLAELKSHPAKVSSLHAASITNDEPASQPNKESEQQKSSVTNNVHPSVNSSKQDFHSKQTSQSGVKSRSQYRQDEPLSDDRISKTFLAELKSHPSKVSSLHAASVTHDEPASPPYKESEKKKSSVTNNVHPSVNLGKQDFPEKQTLQSGGEFRSQFRQDESLSDDRISKAFQADINLHPSKVSSSATIVDNNKDYLEKSTPTNTETCNKGDNLGEFPPCFSEELDVNSAAAASAVALRKAIEKAQESIRIAKESVVRKKEGLRSFSSKSFKDSLKFKGRAANVSTSEEQKEKHSKLKEALEKKGSSTQVFSNTREKFPNFGDKEKLFGAKKFIDEIHGKISESSKNSEIPPSSSHELRENKRISNSKEVAGETKAVMGLFSSGKYESATRSSEMVENNTYEAPKKDNPRPHITLVPESCEKNLGDTEDTIQDAKPRESMENNDEAKSINADILAEGLNDLTVYRKVENEKKISEVSDKNFHDKSFNEALGLLENNKHGFLEHEHNEKAAPYSDEEASEKGFESEKQQKESTSTESCKEDTRDTFYDVSELERIENTKTYVYSLEANEVSLKEDYETKEKEIHKAEELCENLDNIQEPEISENSSSDYDDAEGIERVHACKVGQSDNNVESSQNVDDVSSSSSAQVTGSFYEFQIEEAEAIESEYMSEQNEIFENLSADQTMSEDNEDECETKSDDLSNCGLAAVEQNEVRSESSSDTIHGMEIEVKECNEREGTIEEANVSVEEEENNLQHEERPETRTKMETGTLQEPMVSNEKKDETKESGPSKVVENEHLKRIEEANAEERERERNRLAVERVIREARERAFAEARERAERAAVERATAEVRQRVMADAQEKVSKASIGTKPSDKTPVQSKLRAERAAVERATAEARQRALEKAMSQKKILEPRVQVNEIQQTSSSDVHISNGTSTESAQRIKAKLEKHNRIMERAAKALAEKEKRDLLAQKEQAERSRLSENLDADIKRWSSGKEGNLRALLSTLQYILGADSGWQPVPLTEIITTSAVKKAYRKATLCVHPDKLQQRGASIQQKYICEKVFDLLKAAWNRFNSGER